MRNRTETIFFPHRHQTQLDELAREHDSEVSRLQEALRRERLRAGEERAQFERDMEGVRRVFLKKGNVGCAFFLLFRPVASLWRGPRPRAKG